jgi:hypothetical protein
MTVNIIKGNTDATQHHHRHHRMQTLIVTAIAIVIVMMIEIGVETVRGIVNILLQSDINIATISIHVHALVRRLHLLVDLDPVHHQHHHDDNDIKMRTLIDGVKMRSMLDEAISIVMINVTMNATETEIVKEKHILLIIETRTNIETEIEILKDHGIQIKLAQIDEHHLNLLHMLMYIRNIKLIHQTSWK